MTLRFVESSKLPTRWGVFDIHGFEDVKSDKEHVAITMGDVAGDQPVMLRIHSECLTGDALFSIRCDCGAQLEEAMRRIAAEGRGVILYEQLGFGADLRDYSICQSMLRHLQITRVRLLTNNPRKVEALESLGIEVVERIALQSGRNPHNFRYLATKAGKMGHLFDEQNENEDDH